MRKILLLALGVMIADVICASSDEPKWVDLDRLPQSGRVEILHSLFFGEEHFAVLYQAAKDLQELFEIAKIPSPVILGATLGMLRFGQLLPWDDDLDHAMDIKYEEQLRSLIPIADALGYNLFPDNDYVGYKFYKKEPLINPKTQKTYYLFLDIFLYQLEDAIDEGGPTYRLVRPKGRELFSKAWFYKNEFELLSVGVCGPMNVPYLSATPQFLKRMYGPRCETEALFYFSHMEGSSKTKYKWTVRPETDQYPSHRHIELENRVDALLLQRPDLQDLIVEPTNRAMLDDASLPIEERIRSVTKSREWVR